jgi:hypothetical protein
MRKVFLFLLILTVTATLSPAQQGRGTGRIHAAKVAYITDRLHLSTNQSMTFVPLYDNYERELRATRQSFFNKYRGGRREEQNDATSRQWIDDNLDYQQQVIELKRRYNDEFLKIISPRQLADLYKGEREFNEMLMQRLRQQRNGGPGRYNRMR